MRNTVAAIQNDFSTVTLPALAPEDFLGSVQDIGRSRNVAQWIEKHIPSGTLDAAPLSLVEHVEESLDAGFRSPHYRHIHTGRSRFEIVSAYEAELFRSERRAAWAETEKWSENSGERRVRFDDCVIFGGLSNPRLFNRVIQSTGARMGEVTFRNFANGESQVNINTSVRGCKVFILQTAAEPINENIAELELMVDALKRASASEINVILPLYPYARQDRKGGDRAPVSAAAFASKLKHAGVDRIVTLDIHSKQIEGFFDGPFDSLDAGPIMVPHLFSRYGDTPLMLVGADEGQMKRLDPVIGALQEIYEVNQRSPDIAQALFKKSRSRPNEVEKMEFIGDPEMVRGRTVLLWDDMIDTGGTILKAVEKLRGFNPAKVVVVSTHGIFSFNGIERFRDATYKDSSGKSAALIDEVVMTDTLPMRRGRGELFTVISTDTLLTEALRRLCIGKGESLRELRGFTGGELAKKM